MSVGKKALKYSMYVAAGFSNLAHVASHLYVGAVSASTGHEENKMLELTEKAIDHPLGQALALSFVPIMVYDAYRHIKNNKTIKEQNKRIQYLENLVEGGVKNK